MSRRSIKLLGGSAAAVTGVAAIVAAAWLVRPAGRASWPDRPARGRLTIRCPPDGALFPPDVAAPTFLWEDATAGAQRWEVAVDLPDEAEAMRCQAAAAAWTPSAGQWEVLKRRSLARPARVTVMGFRAGQAAQALSAASVSIRTSPDPVAAPIFYREVIPPFKEAVLDPSGIVWRLGCVSAPRRPPIVLQKLPVCGNCHSFSNDGKTFGMDVDYGNDKGSYVISPVAEEIVLDRRKIISWGDYRRSDGERTFGLLSAVSPDGRYVVSTVKDRSVSAPRDDLTFSLDFFPIKGILVVYDRRRRTFQALPGADDRRFVQSNPAWSPDGKHIVFARSKVHPLARAHGSDDDLILTTAQARKFLAGREPFRYDLYRIPFNAGRGGKAEPLEGASHNGMSNYFPKVSPDGKWIVFCRAGGFMLLRPDSELYIVPAHGGRARRLRCNTPRMNSWHSWSPNSRWLVFASKANSPYTQLFLTHIDPAGRSSPPVVLSRFTSPGRAANIPEFVNAPPDAIKRIREEFLGQRDSFDDLDEAEERELPLP